MQTTIKLLRMEIKIPVRFKPLFFQMKVQQSSYLQQVEYFDNFSTEPHIKQNKKMYFDYAILLIRSN